ncbi:MAG: hypothetical protein KUG75_09380 [Pseudomonadales bacterium]|nr:hypothetical protein [Pseudomonadales bacterium]
MKPETTNAECSQCRKSLICGIDQPIQNCWCATFPPVLPFESGQDCLCRKCLAIAINDYLAESIRQNGIETVLSLVMQHKAGSERKTQDDNSAATEYLDYTLENGCFVFTRWFHLKRGTCCGSGCRNCPYPK